MMIENDDDLVAVARVALPTDGRGNWLKVRASRCHEDGEWLLKWSQPRRLEFYRRDDVQGIVDMLSDWLLETE